MPILAIDWATYFGGWDSASVLAACAAGAAPLAVIVTAQLGIVVAGAVVAFVRSLG
jgi:predicted aconitase with swiveling domain